MKRFVACLGMAILVLGVAGIAAATTFSPIEDADLNDLEHSRFYTWGIDWEVPDGEVIVAASLFLNDIRNYNDDPNDLWVHLLDTVAVGPGNDVHRYWDGGVGGDNFLGQGILLNHWEDLPSTAQDITYVFDASELVALNTYAADDNFGFGFDPDCHFYNDGVTFTIETSAVPEPATMLLVGTGLIGLVRMRRKFRG